VTTTGKDDEKLDIFVHQSSIKAEGFRSLSENQEVEFEVTKDDKGRALAKEVSAPGGEQLEVAPRKEGRKRGGFRGVSRGGRGGSSRGS